MIGDDLVGSALLMGVLLGVLALGELWARLGDPDPEQSRKFVHLASAAACLLFPFLIESPLVVAAMAIGMSAFFSVASRLQLLQSLNRVQRTSRGSEYYAIAIFMVFLLAGDDLWIYFSSVLILGVADAAAALIGTRYGRFRYQVHNGHKSLEGSLAFFAIAVAAILVTAPFFSDLPWPNLIHIALATAALLTCFEAISLDGADNLFVPVAAVIILQKLAVDAYLVLIFQNLHLIAIFAGLFALNIAVGKLTPGDDKPFNAGAIIAFALFSFGTWALAGAPWTMPVVLGFLVALGAWIGSKLFSGIDLLSIRVRPTYRALLMPFVVVLVANLFDLRVEFYGAYLGICAVVLAFVITSLWRPNPEVRGPLYSTRFALVVGLASALIVVMPAWLLFPDVGSVAPLAVIAICAAVSALNYRIVERRPRPDDDEFYWPASQIALSFAVAVAIYIAQTQGLLPQWQIPVGEQLMRHAWQPWW